jgi:putative aldouronate transport system permease protein
VTGQHGTASRFVSGNGLRKRLIQYRVLYFMLLPGIVYFIIFHYIPMYGVTLAFKDFIIKEGIIGSPWVGLKHFEKAFTDPYFFQILKNTLLISIYKLIFGFPVPIIFAILVNEVSSLRFRKAVQTASYLPHFISWVVMGGIFIMIFSFNGPINELIKLFGGNPVLFMADERYFRSLLVVTDIFKSFGWGSIIYFAAISGIDPQLYEAAVIDGAGRWKRTTMITLPMLVPVIAIMLILSMSSILDAGFDQIFNMYNSSVLNVSDIIDTYVYRKGLVEMQYSYSSAVGLFKSLIALILVLVVNRIVRAVGGKEYALW